MGCPRVYTRTKRPPPAGAANGSVAMIRRYGAIPKLGHTMNSLLPRRVGPRFTHRSKTRPRMARAEYFIDLMILFLIAPRAMMATHEFGHVREIL